MHVSCFPDTCVYILCLRLSALHIYTMRESNISQSMLNPGKKMKKEHPIRGEKCRVTA